MTNAQFEQVKKEIRSLLISYKDGISFSEFKKDYYKFIGRNLPSKDFKYRDDLAFLCNMPDAVAVYSSPVAGDYHLMCVADPLVSQIEKMAYKQKPSRVIYRKPRSTISSFTQKSYVIPPCFNKKEIPDGVDKHVIQMLKHYSHGLQLNLFLNAFYDFCKREFKFKDWGFTTLEECLESIPSITASIRDDEIYIHLKQCGCPTERIQNTLKNNAKQQIVPSRGTIADTIDRFPLVDYREESGFNKASSYDFDNNFSNTAFNCVGQPTCSTGDDNTPIISEIIRYNLQKVIDRYPDGIFAVNFPEAYEEVTKTIFNLQSLGFNCLTEVVDALPDMMMRKPLAGSKKDWIIYPAIVSEELLGNDTSPGKCALFLERVIVNTRKILQAYPDGILLTEFIHVYSINCNDVLCLRELGFNSIESFLLSIATRVPLRITVYGDYKKVHMTKFNPQQSEDISKSPVAPIQTVRSPLQMENKLSNMASAETNFMKLKLPSNFDYSKFLPVYTSSIADPGLFFIQLKGDDYSEKMITLYEDIEEFYKKKSSSFFRMQPIDIKVNAACVALWPKDKHWYRAKIQAVISKDIVQVFYVDYGTTEEIPSNLLRYIRREYMELPAQAVRARLSYMIPPRKAHKWNNKVQLRMLELCQDKLIMAKIKGEKDDVLSLILCDTSAKDKDLYINDILVAEGLAECEEHQETSTPVDVQPDVTQLELNNAILNNFAQLLELQPELFTRPMENLSFNSTPSIAPGFNPIPNLSLNARTSIVAPRFAPHPLTMPTDSAAFVPFFPQVVYPAVHFNAATSNNLSAQPSILPNNANGSVEFSDSQTDFCATDGKNPREDSRSSSPEDDIFYEDDDEIFDSICQKFAFKKNLKHRYVKRVKTSDGYIFHVLLLDSKPYVASGDISFLIWNSKNPHYLLSRLPSKEIVLPSVTLVEEENKEFFQQLEKYSVKGIQKFPENQAFILMYPLENVNKILNLFGHPSASLRAKIITECTIFNPSSFHWQHYSDDEVVEVREATTDDDKANELNRLCLWDLKVMRDSIKIKRLKETKNQSGLTTEKEEEFDKLKNLFIKVQERITEVEQISKLFQ